MKKLSMGVFRCSSVSEILFKIDLPSSLSDTFLISIMRHPPIPLPDNVLPLQSKAQEAAHLWLPDKDMIPTSENSSCQDTHHSAATVSYAPSEVSTSASF